MNVPHKPALLQMEIDLAKSCKHFCTPYETDFKGYTQNDYQNNYINWRENFNSQQSLNYGLIKGKIQKLLLCLKSYAHVILTVSNDTNSLTEDKY